MLEALGNIGDFLGGIAVILTLVYVAYQIRQNTRALRVTTMDNRLAHFAHIQEPQFADPEFADLVVRAQADFHQLTEIEQHRFLHYVVVIFRSIETDFNKYQDGLIAEEQWASYRVQSVYTFMSPGFRQVWAIVHEMFSPEFKGFINPVIAEAEASQPQTGDPN